MSKFTATPEQIEAIRLSELGQTMKLIAYAGAGKTATLTMIADSKLGKGLYLAFNKAIAEEASNKLPPSCEARTFHSIAYRGLPKNLQKKIVFRQPEKHGFIKLDANSFEKHIAPELNDLSVIGRSLTKKELVEKQLKKSKQFTIVNTALNKYFMRDDTLDVELSHVLKAIKYVLQIDIEKPYIFELANPLLEYAQAIWADYQDPNGLFIIGHDVYLKLFAISNPVIEADYILFDEAQDADPLMLHILKQQESQVIYVGDPHQQIYEWRGAVNAMQSIQAPFSYLTKSFRFGEEIANVANIFLKYLNEDNPLRHNELVDSSVNFLSYFEADSVLCRTNGGAIEACIAILQSGITDISLELSNIKQMRELIEDIDNFTRSPRLYKEHYLLGDFENEADLADYCLNSDEPNLDIVRPYRLYKKYGFDTLMRVFKRCWKKQDAQITVMTVHSSKGREWDNVILHDDFEGVSFSVKRDKESSEVIGFNTSEAEARLMYVAVTRAKRNIDISGIQIAVHNINAVHIDNFTLTAPVEEEEVTHFEPPKKQPEQAEKIRQRKAREGQKIAMAKGVEFGRPKIPVDKYLEKYSDVVEAVSVGSLTNKEIATLTGASVATIKRVKQKMRQAEAED